ncbi:MAG: DnaJ family domain-containing protein [Anaerolineae bacterium]
MATEDHGEINPFSKVRLKMTDTKREQRQKQLRQLKWDLEEHQLPEEAQQKTTTAQREQERANLIEQRIQEAMANGEFDNLRGKGKPLAFATNPYLDPSQELAFSLLQNNGIAPEWIERDKEIRQEIETARQSLHKAWQEYQIQNRDELDWQRAIARFEESLQKINRKIADFNLIVPMVSCQRLKLRLEEELQRLQ